VHDGLPAIGAVNEGGVVQVLRDRDQAGDEEEHIEPKTMPDVDSDDDRQG
jgi:hypothetical protein